MGVPQGEEPGPTLPSGRVTSGNRRGLGRRFRRARRKLSRRVRHPLHYSRFWVVALLTLIGGLLAGSLAWLGVRSAQLLPVAHRLTSQAQALQQSADQGDLAGVATAMARLRVDSRVAADLTNDPVWALAGHVPYLGRTPAALSTTTRARADLAEAAQPLEGALARLTAQRPEGVSVDTTALRQIGATFPALSAAVDRGRAELATVDAQGTPLGVRTVVQQLRAGLDTADRLLARRQEGIDALAVALGADGPRTTLVLLQQGAESRGTGGLVGAYALIKADRGKLTLLQTKPRQALGDGPTIPVSTVPDDVRDLWSTDLREWAGLNLSPHFPWTGRLVAAGWAAQPGRPPIDGVIAIDQYVLAALIGGTGPITVQGTTITSATAVEYLSRGVYAAYPDPTKVDAVVAELVTTVFTTLQNGRLSYGGLATGLQRTDLDRRVMIWSADPAEQQRLETTPFGGALPENPGPFAMAVVNNGGGNKLDAYLSTAVTYTPGACTNGVRLGNLAVTLANSAPASGLPAYVVGPVPAGSAPGVNRVLLDLYGPVGASAPTVLVDGKDAVFLHQGLDRNHPVWRVALPLAPGQRSTVEVTVVQPTNQQDGAPTVIPQAMLNPVRTAVAEAPKCS